MNDEIFFGEFHLENKKRKYTDEKENCELGKLPGDGKQ